MGSSIDSPGVLGGFCGEGRDARWGNGELIIENGEGPCGGRGTGDGGAGGHVGSPLRGLGEEQQIRGNGRGRSPAPTRVPEVSAAGRCRHRPLRGAGDGASGTPPPTIHGRRKRKSTRRSGCFLLCVQALAWARAAAAGVSRGVSAVSGAFSWGAASRRSRATASISLMRFSWLTRVAPGS